MRIKILTGRITFSQLLIFGVLLATFLSSGCSGNAITTKTSPTDGKVMVRVPAGEFKLGTSADQASDLAKKFNLNPNFFAGESPQQTLALPEFYIDQTPVTNAEYKKFIDANPNQEVPYLALDLVRGFNWDQTARTFPQGREQYPAVLVTWQDAAAYCKWTGKRLPTEAEWEKAARGLDTRMWPWGNEWDASRVWSGSGKRADAAPVGQFPTGASPYGAQDMVGNIWQWTSSLDKPYPYNASDGREDPNATGLRVTRGGAFPFGAEVTRTATRNRFEASDRAASIGFRCVE